MSAAMPGVLGRAHFALDGGRLKLHLPEELAFLAGEHLAARLDQLAGVAGIKTSEIVTK
jgi:exopolyphosphatase/guanosine-5'-triphosphate,3'-diphosphate pyrophosphatase